MVIMAYIDQTRDKEGSYRYSDDDRSPDDPDILLVQTVRAPASGNENNWTVLSVTAFYVEDY